MTDLSTSRPTKRQVLHQRIREAAKPYNGSALKPGNIAKICERLKVTRRTVRDALRKQRKHRSARGCRSNIVAIPALQRRNNGSCVH